MDSRGCSNPSCRRGNVPDLPIFGRTLGRDLAGDVLVDVALRRARPRVISMDAVDLDAISDRGALEEMPAAHYHAAAVRARRLHGEATTPRVKRVSPDVDCSDSLITAETSLIARSNPAWHGALQFPNQYQEEIGCRKHWSWRSLSDEHMPILYPKL
jgi:hypothetical protein